MTSMSRINMQEATRLTREGRLQEAMDLLRGAQPTHARPGAADVLKPANLTFETPARFLGKGLRMPGVTPAAPILPEGASFEERTYSNAGGAHRYKLYIPSSYAGEPLPLVVMLHGCTQDPDDFARGTQMNAVAEEESLLVAYPAQPQSANVSKCWNWFNAGEQQRDGREASLIAGITREIMQDFAVRQDSVYIAGLSAGGAAASIMGATHPDLYAAIGVHSGLACGAARDMPSAFSAMKQGSPGLRGGSVVPAIVFHGDGDTTVHPVNGDQVIGQFETRGKLDAATIHGEAGGRSYKRIVHTDENGRAVLEQWLLHGAGHAWSGGDQSGSYADARGPDASREMIRFFLSHRLRRPADERGA